MIKATAESQQLSPFPLVAVPIGINKADYTSIHQQGGGVSVPVQVGRARERRAGLGLIWLGALVANVDDWRERWRKPTTLFPNDDVPCCPLFLSGRGDPWASIWARIIY